MESEAVAVLEVRPMGEDSHGNTIPRLINAALLTILAATQDAIFIRANEEFYLGRNPSFW
jgi:hypothetical protein